MSEDVTLKRQMWAVDILGIEPHDHVLEIGCGTGLAVSLIEPKLGDGPMLAVDRSQTMLAKARKKNLEGVTAGRVEFIAGDFATLDWKRRKFSKVFSFNVNVFWMDPAEELKALRKILADKGLVYFFYLPPSLGQLKKIKERLPECLESEGFRVLESSEKKFGALRAVYFKAAR